MFTDVKRWTAADLIDEAGYKRLLAEAERDLQSFVVADGTVAFALPAHIVTATKPGGDPSAAAGPLTLRAGEG